MSFRLPSLVKLPSHKVFEYTPRYYDEAAEKRKELLKKRALLADKSDEAYNSLAKENIRKMYSQHYRNKQKQSNSLSNIRLVIIIAALLFLAYYIFVK